MIADDRKDQDKLYQRLSLVLQLVRLLVELTKETPRGHREMTGQSLKINPFYYYKNVFSHSIFVSSHRIIER